MLSENNLECFSIFAVQQALNKCLWKDFLGGAVVKTPYLSARGAGLIPGQRTKILHATWHGQNFF